MKRRRLLYGAASIAAASLLPRPSLADTPLPPSDDWRRVHSGGVVAEATLSPPQITISAPGHAPWVLPFWLRPFVVHPSPDGEFVLVSNAGGNILSAGFAPNDPVLWIYQRPGEEIAQVPLRALMRTRNLERTTSGYVWISGYTWSIDGWSFATPDGQAWHLTTSLTLTRR